MRTWKIERPNVPNENGKAKKQKKQKAKTKQQTEEKRKTQNAKTNPERKTPMKEWNDNNKERNEKKKITEFIKKNGMKSRKYQFRKHAKMNDEKKLMKLTKW